MKKSAACMAVAAILISLAACSDTAKDDNLSDGNNLSATVLQETESTATTPNTPSQTTSETESVLPVTDESEESSLDIETEEILSKPLNSSDYVLNANFTPIYDEVKFFDVPATGIVTSYEGLLEYISSYKDISFVEYEIISKFSPEEAIEITGDNVYEHTATLYQAHIYYDYLHDTPVDMAIYIGKTGTSYQQLDGDPPYVIGQKLISAIIGFDEAYCSAIPELNFYVYNVNGIDLAYHVGAENVSVQSAALVNLDMELLDSERFVITTTANNPVKFTQKSTVEDLTHFIKQDWEARGYDFFDVANFDYDARSKLDTNEDEAVVE